MATINAFTKPKDKDKKEKLLYVILRHGKTEVLKSTGEFIKDSELKKGAIVGARAQDLNQKVNTIKSNLQLAFDKVANGGDVTGAAITAEYERLQSKLNLDKTPEQVKAKRIYANHKVLHVIDREIKELQSQKEERKQELKTLGAEVINTDDLLVTYFAKYTERSKNSLVNNTARNYNSIAALINRYNPSLRIQDVDADCLYNIEDFMISQGLLNQSIENYIGKIKSILNKYSFQLNLSQSYKQYRFTLTKSKKDVVFLSPQQLRDIMSHSKPLVYNSNQPNRTANKGYDRVVDILLMLVSTGLRYSDIFSDFSELIKTETVNGKPREYIYIKPQKTIRKQISCKIPVTLVMKGILERNNYKLRKMEDYYFVELLREFCQDIPSLQETFTEIEYSGQKEIKTKKRLCDDIGSHIGRKTNISYLFAQGLPVSEIIGRSGHTEVNTLMLYAQKTDDIKEQVQSLAFFALP